MDTLFDEVSRILAQPRPRRATLRIVVGATLGGLLPRPAFAWAPIPCGNTQCFPDQGQICCNASLSACCAQSVCLKDRLDATLNVCCPTGKACGGVCCGGLETCCGGKCCETISASPNVPPKATCNLQSGVQVCEKIVPPAGTCNPTTCSATAGHICDTNPASKTFGQCVCSESLCNAASPIEFMLHCQCNGDCTGGNQPATCPPGSPVIA
jgi:hypothetical protein